MRIDLHMHTWLSDGSWSPQQLLAEAQRRRLQAWSITDHDTCAAYEELGPQPGLITGVEMTASHDGREVHIVGLGIDRDHCALQALLADIRAIRRERMACLLAHVRQQNGCDLTWEQVDDGHTQSPSRMHLARALHGQGAFTHAQQAFRELLSDDTLRQLQPPDFPGVQQVATVIRAAGGVAILAHPGVYGTTGLIRHLVDVGELDGLEVNHPRLASELRQFCEQLATERGLLRSCGSDFHYPGARQLGDWRISRAAARPLLARITHEQSAAKPYRTAITALRSAGGASTKRCCREALH